MTDFETVKPNTATELARLRRDFSAAQKVVDQSLDFVMLFKESAVYIAGYDSRLVYRALESLDSELNRYFNRNRNHNGESK
jgi:hypothetical protein